MTATVLINTFILSFQGNPDSSVAGLQNLDHSIKFAHLFGIDDLQFEIAAEQRQLLFTRAWTSVATAWLDWWL
ncbi:hypothetical protein POX_h09441 [Penicillium oxalicum]|uniref:Uncharacterized protein n=1 Tax=Penicillium oxalicum (strain 114-2 / CGMCC 5302) TaxID=933388 RepID=S8B8Q7_PENO1|nr:hypothetical protein POX_h09441 [Penicillium oxalicum]EPS31142.1 hypothetical protein PDE_06097 [Penicillium oxalicum 114-2]KAI2785683.1 hypothetical protein POX_h09441 [Penicillium oxalicum]